MFIANSKYHSFFEQTEKINGFKLKMFIFIKLYFIVSGNIYRIIIIKQL